MSYRVDHVQLTGGDDFITTERIASFASRATRASVSVRVLQDNIVEADEQFDLTLTLPPSAPAGISIGGRNRAIGVIEDSTGKCYVDRMSCINSTCTLRAFCEVYPSSIFWN